MTPEEAPLDNALLAWCGELADMVAAGGALEHGSGCAPEFELAVNGRAVCFNLKGVERSGLHLAEDMLQGERFHAFLAELRSGMPETGWPVRIRISLSGRNSWCRVWPSAMGVCGKLFGRLMDRGNDMVTCRRGWDSRDEVRGLDRLAEGMRLIELACPPSNRPVGAWSSGSDLVGSRHIHLEDVYARSEAEFILKQSLFRRGLKDFREMIEAGQFEPMRNDERCWYTVTELEDLDLHPLGVVKSFTSALEDINAVLSARRTPGLES